MKFIKRLFFGLLSLLVLVVAFALLAPIFFKDQIVANVKQSINSTVNATVDFEDIDVSFLRSFPAINVRLENYSVLGKDEFDGYPLATGTSAGVDLDFWSVISGSKTGNYEIKAVELVDPNIQVYVLKNGKANYDIALPSDQAIEVEGPATTSAMQLNLSQYSIENGRFLYDDRQTETYVELSGLTHSGTGDFTLDVFELDTKSTFSALTLKQGGVAYLKKAEGDLDAIFNIDLTNSVYTFKENDLRLNALKLKMDGSIAMPSDDIVFDMSFQAPANDFRQLWSMIPAAYVAGYENVKTTGTFVLNGTVKGPYNGDKEIYPAFSFDVGIADGSVQYPGRPVGINGINADIKVNSPSSNLDKLTVNIPRFGINLGGDPFSGSFRLATPMSDPNIDAKVNGTIDLNKWSQAIPLEGVSELSGKIIADITMDNVRQSVIEAGNYAAVNMSGQTSITDLVYAADGLPKVQLKRAQADFSPQFVNIPDFAMQLGKSDFSGRAKIDNLLAYFSPDKTMTGTAVVTSNFFDADEWMTEETTTGPATTALVTDNATLESEEELFNRFDFDIDAKVGEIKYDTYRIKNSRMNGRFKANELVINDMGMTMGETSLSGSGRVTNAWDYTFNDATLGGKLNLTSDFVNVEDFMEATTESSSSATAEPTESTAVIPVPENIDLVVVLKAAKVQYTDILLEQMSGNLVVRDQQVVIEEGTTKLLGGMMGFAGAYDTSEPGDPGFRFHYDLKSLGFDQAFQYLNSFKALAPIGEYLQGKFNSDLVVSGKLGPDLFPQLATLDAKGFIQTLDAGLSTFAPLQKVGNALNVKELSNRINLKELKSWFTIEKGQVTIAPFDVKIAGIPMTINGTHGLDQAMNYNISAAVPRTMIEGNIVTGTAIGALDQLASKASSLGLNIEPSDTLNVGIGLTGSMSDPKTKIDLLGAKKGNGQTVGQTVATAVEDRVKEEIGTKIDDTKQQVQGKVDDTKKAAEAAVAATRDSLKRIADQKAQAIKDQAAQKAKDLLTGKDSTGIQVPPAGEVKEVVKDIKSEIEKFNPFKKKKKDGN